MQNLFRRFFPEKEEVEESIDVNHVMQQIKEKELNQDIPLGYRIHHCLFKQFELALNRDITKNYRVTVSQGRERIYSFTVFANQGDYDILEEAYSMIAAFLGGEQNIAQLPDNKIVKGFFYGH